MKIGIDARFFGVAGKGLGRYTEKLIQGLESSETDHTYEIFLTPEGFENYTPKSARFQKVLVTYRWYGFAEQFLYPFFLYRRGLNLMHFPHFNVPLLYRRDFVVTIHDLILLHYPTQKASQRSLWWYWVKYALYKKVIASAIRRAQQILVVSDFTYQDVVTVYPFAKEKTQVIKEGVDQHCLWQSPQVVEEYKKNLWQRAARKQGDAPYALYVGNAYPHKNLEMFLQLASAVPEQDIVLVGKPDYFYNRLQDTVKELGVTNIYFVGGVTEEELAVLYRGATVYVFPSLYEGFGLPPLEAMQHGVPVLAANTGSLPEVLGTAALFASPHDSQEFIAAYQHLWSDQALRTSLRQKGFLQAHSFRWEGVAVLTEKIYSQRDQSQDSCYTRGVL
jgi:glycosyltransferase involved in cell wall biosynthesis